MDSPLWACFFEAEHEERLVGIDAHLKALDDNEMNYEYCRT
jgi:hypothetical protein